MTTRYEGNRPTSEELEAARDHAVTAFERTIFGMVLPLETFSQTQAVKVGTIVVRRHLAIAKHDARLAGCTNDTELIIKTIDNELRLQSILSSLEKGNHNGLRDYFRREATKYDIHSETLQPAIQRSVELKISDTWQKIADALPAPPTDS